MSAAARALPRLFAQSSALLQRGAVVQLAAEQSHKLATVLRSVDGARVRAFDGAHGEWLCTLGKRGAVLTADEQLRPQAADPAAVFVRSAAAAGPLLAFAPVKPDRTRLLVEKAVELGCGALLPVASQLGQGLQLLAGVTIPADDRPVGPGVETALAAARSPPFALTATAPGFRRKADAWAVEAAEQCERLSIPAVLPPVGLAELLAAWLWPALEPELSPGPPLGTAAAAVRALAVLPAAGLTGRRDGGKAARAPAAGFATLPPGLRGAARVLSALLPARGVRLLLVADEAEAGLVTDGLATGAAGPPQPLSSIAEAVELAAGATPPRSDPGAASASGPAALALTDSSATLPGIALLVGPEGGWSAAERAALTACEVFSLDVTLGAAAGMALPAHDGQPGGGLDAQATAAWSLPLVRRVSLGPTVLRAETAAAAALAQLNAALMARQRHQQRQGSAAGSAAADVAALMCHG